MLHRHYHTSSHQANGIYWDYLAPKVAWKSQLAAYASPRRSSGNAMKWTGWACFADTLKNPRCNHKIHHVNFVRYYWKVAIVGISAFYFQRRLTRIIAVSINLASCFVYSVHSVWLRTLKKGSSTELVDIWSKRIGFECLVELQCLFLRFRCLFAHCCDFWLVRLVVWCKHWAVNCCFRHWI